MEDKVDLYEIALFCRDEFKGEHNTPDDKYSDTLYVGISEHNSIKTSFTPHILKGCNQCILVHHYRCLACTKYYSWYNVEFIDHDGVVRKNALDDDYELSICACGSFRNQVMSLTRENTEIYHCQGNWETYIKVVWNLYIKCKECGALSEAVLLGKLTMKDDKILELQKKKDDLSYSLQFLKGERDLYKGLLDKIQLLLQK